MKAKSFLAFFLIPSLAACSNQTGYSKTIFCFDTANILNLFEGSKKDIEEIEKIFTHFDILTDNFKARSETNVYTINQNREASLDKDLYDLLKTSIEISDDVPLFNPLCGSLSNKWKESLKNSQILDETVVLGEVEKIKTSYLIFKDNYTVSLTGESQIDLGAIAKGYVLDKTKEYLDSKTYKKYLINAGYSSVLLGEKNSDDGLFNVGISGLSNSYLKLKNCFVSTSGVLEQGKKIGGVTYSHIVNPLTGSAVNNYDEVVVVSSSGYLGDVLSTVMMMSSIEEIKEFETHYNVQAIAIKNSQIVYKNDDLEVLKH